MFMLNKKGLKRYISIFATAVILLGLMAVSPVTVHATEYEIIENGGFEEDFAGWQVQKGQDPAGQLIAEISNTDMHSGNTSLHVVDNSTTNLAYVYKNILIDPTKTYRVVFWARWVAGNAALIMQEHSDPTNFGYIKNDVIVLDSATAGWKQYTATLGPAGSGATYALSPNAKRILFMLSPVNAPLNGSTGEAYYDDISFKIVSEGVQMESIILSIDKTTLNVGEGTQATVNGIIPGGQAVAMPDGAQVVYSVSDNSIVEVDEQGNVTAKSKGETDITARVDIDGQSYTSNSVTVRVIDDGPIRPPVDMDTSDLVPPEWIKETWRWADLSGVTSRDGYNMDQVMADVAQSGVKVIWHNAKNGGYLYWPTQTGIVAPELGGSDDVQEGINAAHAHGLKYIAYFWALYDQAASQHPDWRSKTANGAFYTGNGNYAFSPASPAREFIQTQLVELVTKYDVDGIWLDMMYIPTGGDYNEYSVSEFKMRYGVNPPIVENPEDPLWQKWIQFNYDMITETLVQWNRAIKAIKPDVALMGNTFSGWAYRNRSNGRSSADVVKGLDAVLEEVGWYDGADPNLFGFPTRESFMSLYLSSISNNNALADDQKKVAHIWSAAAMQGKETSKIFVASTPQELKARAMEAITYGAMPWLPFYNVQAMSDLYHNIENLEPWLVDAERVPWAALVVSENTEFWYGKTDPINRYVKNLYGIFDIFAEEHMPLEIITDRELEEGDLSPYKVLVLANTAALSDAAAQKLKDYVNNGGGLVATYESGAYDEKGLKREENALNELLGFNAENSMAPNGTLYIQQPLAIHPSIDERLTGTIISYGWDRAGFKVGGNLPYAGTAGIGLLGHAEDSDEVVLSATDEINGNASYDIMIARQLGSGKVVYIPLDAGTAYYKGRAPYLRQWITGAVKWAVSEASPVEIKAPLVVQSSAFHKDDTLIVHLLNDISSFGRATVANGDQLGIREEVLPIYDIEVTFRVDDKKYKEFRLQPGNIKLKDKKNKDGSITVTVPKLETHAMIVAEPKK